MTGKRICLWSGPRNVSTALMYAFRQRPDTTVVDEPLYARYLAWSGIEHPGTAAVLAAQSADPDEVLADVIFADYPGHVFFKQMAHHLQGLDLDWLDRVDNVLLSRHPTGMLRSLTAVLGAEVTVAETALPLQVALLERMLDAGRKPLVVISEHLLADPAGVLTALCDGLGIGFDAAMLSWPAGPKPEDGVWAPHWYAGVHRSTGFEPPRPAPGPLPAGLQPLLEECRPLYERLAAHALRAG